MVFSRAQRRQRHGGRHLAVGGPAAPPGARARCMQRQRAARFSAHARKRTHFARQPIYSLMPNSLFSRYITPLENKLVLMKARHGSGVSRREWRLIQLTIHQFQRSSAGGGGGMAARRRLLAFTTCNTQAALQLTAACCRVTCWGIIGARNIAGKSTALIN